MFRSQLRSVTDLWAETPHHRLHHTTLLIRAVLRTDDHAAACEVLIVQLDLHFFPEDGHVLLHPLFNLQINQLDRPFSVLRRYFLKIFIIVLAELLHIIRCRWILLYLHRCHHLHRPSHLCRTTRIHYLWR